MRKHNLDMVCRSSQVVEEGYIFSANRRLITIYSVPNIFGHFDSSGAMMCVDESMIISLRIIKRPKVYTTDSRPN